MRNKIVWREPGTLFANVSGQAGGNLTVNWWEYEPEDNVTHVRAFILSSYLESESNSSKVDYDLDCDMNQSEADARGYVNNPKDWKNVEITGHFFIKSVADPGGALYILVREGVTRGEGGGNCCQFHDYGVELYWSQSSDFKGKFRFTKGQSSSAGAKIGAGGQIGGLFSQSIVPSFYQKWFGVKFIVYNIPNQENRVRLELWLTNVTFGNPSHSTSNQWTRVAAIDDFPGFGWGKGGLECDAETDDYPITWGAPFLVFGHVGGKVVQWNYLSFREINPAGSLGQDPPPNENPGPTDPTLPDPDPVPNQPPLPPPPDATPPQTPQTMTKRFTLRREVVNNTSCRCDGIIAVPPGEPGGNGGGQQPPGGGGPSQGVFTVIYNVPLNVSDFGRLATVSGNTGYYLRMGQGCTRSSSNWIGKSINRVELTIGKFGTPTGDITCTIRRASNDSIAATLTPTKTAQEIATAGTPLVFENLTNTYKMVLDDMVLIEFSGGDINNYLKVFRVEQSSTSGSKILFRNNTHDPGEYGDSPDLDLCATIKSLTP